MTPSRDSDASPAFDRLRAAFHRLTAIDVDARGEELRLIAHADPEFAGQLRALLAHLDESDLQAATEKAPPEQIGPFRILHRLGRGGMGEVFLAERVADGMTQRVALKLVRHAALSPDMERRLVRERGLLARLSHPRVAGLIDAGSSDSHGPWFAMEYVEGKSITRYADDQRLSVADRVTLWLQVADAVAYAHRHAIVHRDLKPANVLVDVDGNAKLLDFGIAKLVEMDSDAASTAVAFTARYASPEQITGEPVTTATDVHGLGLLLYELLAGEPPFRDVNDLKLRQAIAYTDPPSLLASLDQGGADRAIALAQARHASPSQLRRELGGDIDAVVGKALRKRTAERYGSVPEFAADVQRFLDGRAVAAVAPTRRYRLRRFVARHRIAVAALAIALTGLIVGLASALHQRAQLLVANRQAQAENEVLLEILQGADPDHARGADLKLRDMLALATDSITSREDLAPELRAHLLASLGSSAYFLGLDDVALRAFDGYDRSARAADDIPASLGMAVRLHRLGMTSGAETRAALDELLRLQPQIERIGGETLIDAWELRSMLHANLREYPQALDAIEKAMAVPLVAAERTTRRRRIGHLNKRTNLLLYNQRIDDALASSAEAMEQAAAIPEDLAIQVNVASSRADALLLSNRQAEALPLLEQMREPAERHYEGKGMRFGRYLLNLARAQRDNGQVRASLESFERGIAVYQAASPDSQFSADASDRLGGALLRLDEFARAQAVFTDAARGYALVFGKDDGMTRTARIRSALCGLLLMPDRERLQTTLAELDADQDLPLGVALLAARAVLADGDLEAAARRIDALFGRYTADVDPEEAAHRELLLAMVKRRQGDAEDANVALANAESFLGETSQSFELRARIATARIPEQESTSRCAAIWLARSAWSAIDPTGAAWSNQHIDTSNCTPAP